MRKLTFISCPSSPSKAAPVSETQPPSLFRRTHPVALPPSWSRSFHRLPTAGEIVIQLMVRQKFFFQVNYIVTVFTKRWKPSFCFIHISALVKASIKSSSIALLRERNVSCSWNDKCTSWGLPFALVLARSLYLFTKAGVDTHTRARARIHSHTRTQKHDGC